MRIYNLKLNKIIHKYVSINNWIEKRGVPQVPGEGWCDRPTYKGASRTLRGAWKARKRHWFHQEELGCPIRHRRRATNGRKRRAQKTKRRLGEENRICPIRIRGGEGQATVSNFQSLVTGKNETILHSSLVKCTANGQHLLCWNSVIQKLLVDFVGRQTSLQISKN